MDDMKREAMAGVAKLTPPTTASMWLMLGNHLDDWIKIATLVYIIVQVTVIITGKWLLWTGRIKRDDEYGRIERDIVDR